MLDNSFGRFSLGFKKLRPFLEAIDESIVRRIPRKLAPLAACLGSALPSTAHSEQAILTRPESEIHIALGPILSGVRAFDGWDTQVGGEIHLARLSRKGPSMGVAIGASTFARNDAVRLALEGYTGLALSDDWTVGIAVSPILDLFPTHRPLAGVGGSLWLHAGVAPFLAVSRVWGLGAADHYDITVGMRIPFSVARF